jgi:uncharacterized protein YegP (UPF0339 family)
MNKKYQVYKDVAGKFRFRLKAESNQIVAVSQGYENHSGCLNGVHSVQSNCNSEIEDMTIEGARIPNPKYQVFYDKSCGYRFHLSATNGEIIAASEGYESKEGCMNGIKAVQSSCNAEIEDLAVAKPTVSTAPAMETAEAAVALSPEIIEAPVCEEKELKLELNELPAKVAKGEVVLFRGKITENCQGKGKIQVSIREHDRSFFFDKVLAKGYADENGSFTIGWNATTFDFWDNKGEIYAQYDREQKPKHVRSEFKTIFVE